MIESDKNSLPPRSNGAPATDAAAAKEAARGSAATRRIAAAFGEIAWVFLRTPAYRHLFLADLEWLVMPAITTGQFALAEARQKDGALSVPVAVLLWARVSDEVDARLAANLEQPRLKPTEWASGPNVWLIKAVGDPRAVKALMDQLLAGPLAGRDVKVVARGADGKPALQVLKGPAKSADAAKPSSLGSGEFNMRT